MSRTGSPRPDRARPWTKRPRPSTRSWAATRSSGCSTSCTPVTATCTTATSPATSPSWRQVDPDLFAISIVTADGFGYDVGDERRAFTIQSISKPFVYGLALEDCGHDEVLRRIGVEPSGDAFNSITFDESNNRPFNPMVNAGAIATAA